MLLMDGTSNKKNETAFKSRSRCAVNLYCSRELVDRWMLPEGGKGEVGHRMYLNLWRIQCCPHLG